MIRAHCCIFNIFKDESVLCNNDEDENDTSVASHIKAMTAECRKITINVSLLEDRMKRTFGLRRKEVYVGNLTVQNLIEKYPALRFPSCVRLKMFSCFFHCVECRM